MGAAASAASSPPEAAAAADPPAKGDVQPVAASPPLEAADPPAKEDIQHAAAADAPPEAAAPTDRPAKEDTQTTAAADALPEAAVPADSPAKEEIQPAAGADAPGGDAEAAGETVVLDAGAESGEPEEEGECGFCLYMKGGGCKDEFVEWEKCIQEAEAVEGGDIVEHCAKVTAALRSCMDKYADYYEPILSVERRMSEDLDAEAKASQDSPASPPAAAEGEQGDNKKQAEEEVVVVVEEKEDIAA